MYWFLRAAPFQLQRRVSPDGNLAEGAHEAPHLGFMLGGTSVTAAAPWAALTSAVLPRTNFFHYTTGATVHGDHPKAMRLLGQTHAGGGARQKLVARLPQPRVGVLSAPLREIVREDPQPLTQPGERAPRAVGCHGINPLPPGERRVREGRRGDSAVRKRGWRGDRRRRRGAAASRGHGGDHQGDVEAGHRLRKGAGGAE